MHTTRTGHGGCHSGYYATGDPQFKVAGENAFAKFDRQRSVSGSLPGDEDNQGRDPSPENRHRVLLDELPCRECFDCGREDRRTEGDAVKVTFETPVEAVRWVNNEHVLKSRPLVFAADLGTIPTKYDKFPSGHTTREMSDGKLPIYGFAPKDPDRWTHCGLDGLSKEPAFGFKRTPVKTANPDQPWAKPPVVLQGQFNRMRGKTRVDLVPMGCTVLRRVTFPVGCVQSTRKKGPMVDDKTSE